jgi:hypothetical protein
MSNFINIYNTLSYTFIYYIYKSMYNKILFYIKFE